MMLTKTTSEMFNVDKQKKRTRIVVVFNEEKMMKCGVVRWCLKLAINSRRIPLSCVVLLTKKWERKINANQLWVFDWLPNAWTIFLIFIPLPPSCGLGRPNLPSEPVGLPIEVGRVVVGSQVVNFNLSLHFLHPYLRKYHMYL